MAVIIPCAGKSSRYPGTLPKYLLELNNGQLMFEKAVENLNTKQDIYFIIPQDHQKKYKSKDIILSKKKNKNFKVFTIKESTNGPAETVYKLAKKMNEPIFIHDCDSFFDYNLKGENTLYTINLKDHLNVFNVSSKSFAIYDNNYILKDIIEKNISSNSICCGGYEFQSSKDFCKHYEMIKNNDNEIFVSHVIKSMIINDNIFKVKTSKNLIDLGTLKEYLLFKKKYSTLFVYLEDRFFTKKINKKEINLNLNKIQFSISDFIRKNHNGSKIIFLSSLDKFYHNQLNKIIKKLGFKNFDILLGISNYELTFYDNIDSNNSYKQTKTLNTFLENTYI